MSREFNGPKVINFNKYIALNKSPEDMILPVVIDLADLEEVLSNLISKVENKVIVVKIDGKEISNGKLKVKLGECEEPHNK